MPRRCYPRQSGVDTSSRPSLSLTGCQMNLIYSHNYATARTFAHNHELVPGDWKWIRDARVLKAYPRADVYKVSHWEANPHRADIDAALYRAVKEHRLGMLTDYSQAH